MQYHIAILHHTAPPIIGGVESVLGHHARLMTQAGHQVRVVAARGGDCPNLGGASFYHFPLADSQHETILSTKRQLDQGQVPTGFELLVFQIFEQMEEAFANIDVVIAHNVCSLHKNLALTVALRRYCAQAQAPKLIVWHHDFAWMSGLYEGELHAGYPWDVLRKDWPEVNPVHVVVSEPRQREFSELFQCSTEKATVIPNGLDLQHFLNLNKRSENLFSQIQLVKGDPILLLPVRITRRKNIELAIKIVRALETHFSNPKLIITGPPGAHNQDNVRYLQELIELRNRLGLNPDDEQKGAVYFMAETHESHLPSDVVHDFFRLTDGLLLPSFEEGFGIPVLEAGLAGVPVFASDIASLKAIGQESAVWFAPDGDSDDIALKIKERLVGDPVFELKKRVRQEFVWEEVYEKYIAPLLDLKVNK